MLSHLLFLFFFNFFLKTFSDFWLLLFLGSLYSLLMLLVGLLAVPPLFCFDCWWVTFFWYSSGKFWWFLGTVVVVSIVPVHC